MGAIWRRVFVCRGAHAQDKIPSQSRDIFLLINRFCGRRYTPNIHQPARKLRWVPGDAPISPLLVPPCARDSTLHLASSQRESGHSHPDGYESSDSENSDPPLSRPGGESQELKEPDAPLRCENSSAKQQVQLQAPRRTPASSLKFAAFPVTRRSVCQSHRFRHVFFFLLFQFRQLILSLSCHVAAAHGIAEQFSLPQEEEDVPDGLLSVHSARLCGVSVAVDSTW